MVMIMIMIMRMRIVIVIVIVVVIAIVIVIVIVISAKKSALLPGSFAIGIMRTDRMLGGSRPLEKQDPDRVKLATVEPTSAQDPSRKNSRTLVA